MNKQEVIDSTFQIDTEDKRNELIDEIKNELNDHKLFIWGCGSYSRIVSEYLSSSGISEKPIYIVDDEYVKGEKSDVIKTSIFLKKYAPDSVVVFGIYDYELVQNKKKQYSGLIYKMYEFHFGVVNDKRIIWDPVQAKHREDEYRKTYDLLSDDVSKRIMQSYLNAATAGRFDELYTLRTFPSYFNEYTNDIEIETLIDCGAFDGDSIHDFINVHKEYKNIIAFEPDSDNVNKIREREKRESIKELLLVKAGVYSFDGNLYFNEKGESNSFLSEDGDIEITVSRIDKYIDHISEKSLIKMDIEGSELEALKGAKETIERYNPVLTICVYHKEEDLIEIPLYINSIVGENAYNYYLGFHGTDLAELVFYAIPKSEKRVDSIDER